MPTERRGEAVETHARTVAHSGGTANCTLHGTLASQKEAHAAQKPCCSGLWSEADISASCKINTSLVKIFPPTDLISSDRLGCVECAFYAALFDPHHILSDISGS